MGAVPRTYYKNPLRDWLSLFLLVRQSSRYPDGRPLYSYQVTSNEYVELRDLLKEHRAFALQGRYADAWAACFCLFVAECFRREYDASESGWAWSTFERRLDCTFTQQQHAELVTAGLARYWKRPIHQRERGRDLLGSIFTEGGLPWLLVQSESHGFGRAVRKGLKHFYQAEHARRTTSDLMGDFESFLPQTFRNLETRQLLAGIVEQLMHLAADYPLRDQPDPAAYLDKHHPVWREAFPIPLDETNARGLINEWLKDAGQRRVEQKEHEERAIAFTSMHRLQSLPPEWNILTELVLPKTTVISLAERCLTTTRMEMYFYEGEKLLAKGGVVYGQLAEGELRVRFPLTHISLIRRVPTEPVSLHLIENGKPVHIFHFEDSALELEDLPLVFERRGDDWWFVANASCNISSDRARIRLPAGFANPVGAVIVLCSEPDGATWFEIKDSLRFSNGTASFCISVNDTRMMLERPALQGNVASYSSIPSTVFVGWPRLTFQEGHLSQGHSALHYVNGAQILPARMKDRAGLIRYSVRNQDGELLLQRRFGVIPTDLQVSLYPASSSRPARLDLRTTTALHVVISDHNLHNTVVTTTGQNATTIVLEPVGDTVPSTFSLEISSHGHEPVVLRLPYPYQGARLIGPGGDVLESTELILDELSGMRVALSAGLPYGERFTIQMELIYPSGQRLKRHYVIDVGSIPVLLNLFSYQNDMMQMFGAVNEQDAYIRLTVETQQRLLCLNIRRYNGRIQWLEDRRKFMVVCIATNKIIEGAQSLAMLLPDPKQEPIGIPELTSEGVGVNVFAVPREMERQGPWIIYRDKSSSVLCRPELYVPAGCNDSDEIGEIHSLHNAAKIFHPVRFPRVIDEQIAAMAEDLSHSGWQYVADLKTNFSHLPLSAFESWRSISRHPETLALVVLRLEIDEAFCARIRDELAVIWECIPLPLWAVAYDRYRSWLALQSLPEVLQKSILQNRKAVLPAVVSGFEHVGDYLETGDASRLRKLQPAFLEGVLPEWYQSLRRSHAANPNWPTDLGGALEAWVKRQDLPGKVTSLSQWEHSNAVTYLPIFMAYVTAGKVQFDELAVSPAYLKYVVRVVSDFDRHSWYMCVHAMMVSYLLAGDHRH